MSNVITIEDFKVNEEDVKLVQGRLNAEPDRIARAIYYMHLRTVEKLGRVKAFRRAFPDRCKYGANSHMGRFEVNKDRDEISEDAIIIKAKRLENSKLYEVIMNMLSTSMFAKYFIARMKVLDEALEKIFDPEVKDIPKVQYMKLFLEETRKAEEAKGMEVNIHVGDEYKQVSNNINIISKRLEGLGSEQIIDLISQKDDK